MHGQVNIFLNYNCGTVMLSKSLAAMAQVLRFVTVVSERLNEVFLLLALLGKLPMEGMVQTCVVICIIVE